ncbi:class I SAM-dependent methyltransferase [Azoarcus olearius]|uniref:Methyltransferase n=1 Tax=Azoarcus sp. (strain BH72) TaxID=418699 RepID=A1KAD5_AZOSB|nr:class I SAM-dependent methyltransferase [Azoarcus olearius]CAL95791.1 putative methyltransferase [Azoarcus olearius]
MRPTDIAIALFRELTQTQPLERLPEPEMLMEEQEQVAAYAESGRTQDGVMAAANLFHSARASMVIARSRRVLDLGCGPATQLARIARLNPDISFVGAELSAAMLENGRQHIAELGLGNVELVEDDITRLETVADGSVDAVISTMTLHHLPTLDHLRECFRQIRRVLRPGGAVYLADFGRLRSKEAVHLFAHMHENSLPPVVVTDYENSLRAAFSLDEYRALTAETFEPAVTVRSTAVVPVMVLVKTQDLPLAPDVVAQLHRERARLSPAYRGELDSLRRFFRLGGLRNDPF